MKDEDERISLTVQEWAYSLFCDLGIENDFCVQYVGCGAIVFGGRNRILFGRKGFRLDESYCDDDVIEKFNKMKGEGK